MMIVPKYPAGNCASRCGRINVCTLPTTTRNQLPRQRSSAFSTAHISPVDLRSLSAAWSSSSPRWASTSTRSPAATRSEMTAENTMVFPVPVGSTSRVRARPPCHSDRTASRASI